MHFFAKKIVASLSDHQTMRRFVREIIQNVQSMNASSKHSYFIGDEMRSFTQRGHRVMSRTTLRVKRIGTSWEPARTDQQSY